MATRRLDLRIDPEDWVIAAACRGHQDLFFAPEIPESRAEKVVRERKAKELCGVCVVRVECLNEALASGERFGIWGGMNERERRSARVHDHARTSRDIAGPGRLARLPAVVVQGRQMSTTDRE